MPPATSMKYRTANFQRISFVLKGELFDVVSEYNLNLCSTARHKDRTATGSSNVGCEEYKLPWHKLTQIYDTVQSHSLFGIFNFRDHQF
jgi:hypothetical protein